MSFASLHLVPDESDKLPPNGPAAQETPIARRYWGSELRPPRLRLRRSLSRALAQPVEPDGLQCGLRPQLAEARLTQHKGPRAAERGPARALRRGASATDRSAADRDRLPRRLRRRAPRTGRCRPCRTPAWFGDLLLTSACTMERRLPMVGRRRPNAGAAIENLPARRRTTAEGQRAENYENRWRIFAALRFWLRWTSIAPLACIPENTRPETGDRLPRPGRNCASWRKANGALCPGQTGQQRNRSRPSRIG